MKFFNQTQLHTKEIPGNCWATCLAMLLELESIPALDILADNWWEQSQAIAKTKNKQLVEFVWGSCRIPDKLYVIASGESPRKDWEGKTIYHCVLAQVEIISDGYKVTCIHDPHPERKGLLSFEYITIAV